ncbi:MAG: FecR family protein [Longimicrobiaceae bacterium]
MNEPIDWTLLDRYLAGEASAEEAARVERWLAASPERAAMVRALRGPGAASDVRTDAAWASLSGRIAAAEPATIGRRAPAWGRRSHAPLLRAAAIAGLLVGGAAVWRIAAPRGPEPMAVVATAAGATRTVVLDDGSRVTLGAASRLEHPRRFRGNAREVVLEGEAFFEVAHDARRPFTVRSGGALTRVLGTRFDVRGYAGEPVRVVVESGRVRLRPAGAGADTGVVLVRGELGEAAPGRPVTRRAGVDPARYAGWREGRLEFERAELSQAARELERWYGVEVRVTNPALARRHLTLTLARAPLDEVLDAISLSLGARWSRTGRTILISPSPRKQP